jgi:hypothetical protein
MASVKAISRVELLCIAVVLTCVVCTIGIRLRKNNFPPEKPWIGGYPGLQQVHKGMTKSDVCSVLGKPTHENVKKSVRDNVFGQGSNEANIREAWIYAPVGWNGHIEVYFGITSVVGVNFGNG